MTINQFLKLPAKEQALEAAKNYFKEAVE